MTDEASATRWTRIIRRLLRDAVAWSDAVAARMGTSDPPLRQQLAGEAVALAACMLHEQLRRNHVDTASIEALMRQLRDDWATLAARRSGWAATPAGSLLPPQPDQGTGNPSSFPPPAGLGNVSMVDTQQAALEFQRATGLGPEALVNDGHNLASLIFYHRVFLAARSHPAFTPTHRAPIIQAAQQCRERFARVLQRARGVEKSVRPRLAPVASRLLPGV
jgi:hypothetical protein